MNKQVKPLKVSIQTFGCQMNQYDTEVAEGMLEKAGYEIVQEFDGEEKSSADPANMSSPKVLIGDPKAGFPIKEFGNDRKTRTRKNWRELDADVVLLNTCSVREHAEDRVFGRLGMLGKEKKTNPNLIVGLMGCMVEEHREKLFKRFPQLDLMVGTRNIKELPDLVEEVRRNRQQVARIKQDGISIEYTEQIKRQGKFHAWLPIMTGCNKVCTFCIVPITRGSEVSMPAREVYREASRLVEEGVKWITLLGQNVNSYNGCHSRGPHKEGGSVLWRKGGDPSDLDSRLRGNDKKIVFPDLLEMLCEIPGLERISFTTSHPHDATEELFQVIARNPKISRRFHLPLQSGSDRILKRMKRLHTFQEYREKIKRLRELVPDIAITTDIIAGFSGETEDDHQSTVRALEEIRCAGAYIYKYSLRPATPASKLPDDVPLEVKEKRNAELLAVQKRIAREINARWIGKTVEVFVEEMDSKNSAQVLGRTDAEKKVAFPGEAALIGGFHQVKLETLRNETFLGTPSP